MVRTAGLADALANKRHHFRITVKAVDTPSMLGFDHVNHVNIIAIAGHVNPSQ